MSDKALLCDECPRVATYTIGDLLLCQEHYEEFNGELEVMGDLENHGD